MADIPVIRAAHLVSFVRVLRSLGTPVDRELARAKLPTLIEEIPNDLVPLSFSLDFVSHCVRLEGIPDIGFLVSQNFRLVDLGPEFLRATHSVKTLHELLLLLIRMVRLEDNRLSVRLQSEGRTTRIICDINFPEAGEKIRYSEWLQLKGLIEIIRRGAGAHWQPREVTFVSRSALPPDVMANFGNTRFVVGHAHTSITAPTELLAAPVYPLPLPTAPTTSGDGLFESSGTPSVGLAETLSRVVQSYLREGYPHIALAAEIAGTSVRTLQRALRAEGRSYSDVVLRARMQIAAEILCDPQAKVSEAAFAVGYEDASNFTRAFRRMNGLSPREYRIARLFRDAAE